MTTNRSPLALFDPEQISNLAKDAAYLTVGFGVLTFQRAQVRRQDLLRSVRDQFEGLDERYRQLEVKLDDAVDGISRALPDPAADLLHTAHRSGKAVRHQVASKVGLA